MTLVFRIHTEAVSENYVNVNRSPGDRLAVPLYCFAPIPTRHQYRIIAANKWLSVWEWEWAIRQHSYLHIRQTHTRARTHTHTHAHTHTHIHRVTSTALLELIVRDSGKGIREAPA